MADLDRQLKEDRALRDAARQLIEADLGLVKSDVKERSVGKRAADFVGSESRYAAQEALSFAAQRPFLISGVLVAILAFLFRNSILDAIIDWLEDEKDSDPDDADREAQTRDWSETEHQSAERRSHHNTAR